MTLPCYHQDKVVNQVQPTIELLNNLDTLHPDVLLEHSIEPLDYTQGLVNDVLENLLQQGQIVDYKHRSSRERFDFEIQVEQSPDYFVVLEVKGGEGNSINVSERPLWAKEFFIWSHLDGAIVNHPSHGAHSIVNRITNEMVKRRKLVDALFFKDILCGIRTRPCPTYPDKQETMGYMLHQIFLCFRAEYQRWMTQSPLFTL